MLLRDLKLRLTEKGYLDLDVEGGNILTVSESEGLLEQIILKMILSPWDKILNYGMSLNDIRGEKSTSFLISSIVVRDRILKSLSSLEEFYKIHLPLNRFEVSLVNDQLVIFLNIKGIPFELKV